MITIQKVSLHHNLYCIKYNSYFQEQNVMTRSFLTFLEITRSFSIRTMTREYTWNIVGIAEGYKVWDYTFIV